MITVPKIQIALKRDFNNSSTVMAPNIFLWGVFESDFVRVTKSGYGIEYEIKLSKSDFKADFKKKKLNIVGIGSDRHVIYNSITKHEWLSSGKGPTEFYYVFPEGLIKHEDVPEWAGIIEVYEHISNYYQSGSRMCLKPVRNSKRLNKEKLSTIKLNDIYTSCYYRYWSEVEKRNTNQILML
jgi:hypothetical protein